MFLGAEGQWFPTGHADRTLKMALCACPVWNNAEHATKYNLLPVLQSAYRPFHSTETAVIGVMNDMIKAIDQGHVGALMLLDLSAAFDLVDPSILKDVMQRRFGVCGKALDWMADSDTDRWTL